MSRPESGASPPSPTSEPPGDANPTANGAVLPTSDTGGFSRRTVAWLVAIGAASFACAVFFAIYGEEISMTSSAAPDSFSRSAIGHRGLVELLRTQGVPVLVSQSDTADKLANDATLVVAEPAVVDADGVRAAELRRMIGASRLAILVLPKWYGEEDSEQPAFVERVYLLPEDEVEPVLGAVGVSSGVVRAPPGERLVWSSSPRLEGQPDLAGAQLLEFAPKQLDPLLWTGRGALVASVYGFEDADTALWIVSDPDLLSNHGLVRGDNAALILSILRRAAGSQARAGGESGALVFDETMHGFRSEPSLWRVLFEFPLVLATLQALLAVGLLVWAATGRFGKPVAAAPALAPGVEFLIDNSAALLRFAGHAGAALSRYLETAVQDAARALHAPASLDAAGTARWLDQLASARGLSTGLAELEAEVNQVAEARGDRARQVTAAALRVHRWRQEMIHGSADRPRPR